MESGGSGRLLAAAAPKAAAAAACCSASALRAAAERLAGALGRTRPPSLQCAHMYSTHVQHVSTRHMSTWRRRQERPPSADPVDRH